MNLKGLYQNRFSNLDQRKRVWKVLVRDYFQKYFLKNDVVIDIGCGYCEFINEVKAKKKYGLDVNKDIRKHADKNVELIFAYSTKIPLKKNEVTKVFISNFFEHITKEQTEKTLIEVKRILKKGGKVIVLQPNIRFLAKDYWQIFDHVTPVDDRALVEIFEIHNFVLEKRVLRFLPFTMRDKSNIPAVFVSLYLKMPFIWFFFGKQSLLVFRKK